MHWPLRLVKALFVLLLMGSGSAHTQEMVKVRMGFVLSFARYVEWPHTAFKSGMPMLICLAPGDPDMAGKMGTLTNETIQNRPVLVKELKRSTETEDCEVLYLPAELPTPVAAWLNSATKTGALTVSDLPDFVDKGGMIGLVPINGRYRYDINLGNARLAGLRFNVHLLKLARTVK